MTDPTNASQPLTEEELKQAAGTDDLQQQPLPNPQDIYGEYDGVTTLILNYLFTEFYYYHLD